MLYRPHVREYSVYELDEMIRPIGFEIVRRETLDVWRNAISMREHAQIKRFIEEENYPQELRGEDIFLLARRPLETTKPS
jgi:tRNA(Leu) C34 or U34 (ribose-2'-O)-methylase TrmL